ncbi:ATP-binding protein [Granulicella mallensis]|uniref:histidine kinase n=1 Tax=Granulicella mallensis (strain ATCC BAA-1857 / DSM 23137 / MP5ACTX8) TaxID=682795 RepID=G8NNU8_GRAMM|nr:ATP-binding protein [Granulicella mallensis]AEU35973.1 multi-sensor signal transduction histidine kinase [Granulicella mallensis MP5ACTX8]
MNLSQLNRVLLQTLLIPVVALMFVAAILSLQIENAERTVAQMRKADNNIATATLVSVLMVNEESGLRGYQITSNEIFLQPYDYSQVPLDNALHELRDGLTQQGSDPSAVDDFIMAHNVWRNSFAAPLIAATSAGQNTRDSGLNLRGKAQMDALSDRLNNIVESQKAQRTLIVDTWQRQVRETLEILIALALIIGLAIGFFARSRLHQVSAAFQATLASLRLNAQRTYESEQRLRTTLTSIGDGVIVCDVDGTIELLNLVAQQLTGWSQAEAVHKPLEEVFRIVHETTREPLETPFAMVKKLQRVISLSNHALLLRRDGSELNVDDSGAPIHDRSGKLVGVVMVFRDITEQLRSQAALLATEKLAVAGRLAATLAHEIHNPLDAVGNLLYLMKDGATPEESTQFLQLASQELDRVTQISRAMLGMYRESKTPVIVDVKEMLESVLLLLNRQMSQLQLEVRTEFASNASVTGYPVELRQVFINLLSNAADASTQGGIIAVRTKLRSAVRSGKTGGRQAGVEITISDNGVGISDAALPQVFQPFFTTKGEHGTGLGLWVSHGIIEKHSGTIEIESSTDEQNHGTRITVFLPRLDS